MKCDVCNDTGKWEVEPGEIVDCYMGCDPTPRRPILIIEEGELPIEEGELPNE